jgi:hypothetical protein
LFWISMVLLPALRSTCPADTVVHAVVAGRET